MCRAILCLSVVFLSAGAGFCATDANGNDRKVVIVVWDGMRPDFVTEKNAPVLWKMAQEGVLFKNHHSVYLTATHVNAAAIETGMYPEHDGLIANYDYRPDISARTFVSTEQPDVIDKGDAISGGHYLKAPTLAEIVRRSGGRTAVAAAKTVGILLDRQPDRPKPAQAETLSAGRSRPSDLISGIERDRGDFPVFPIYSSAARDKWTTDALTKDLWKDAVPRFSLLWLGEPDLTQHETAPGSPAALAAIKSSDDNLGTVLAALEEKGARSTTDLFVVSDHGFSTIGKANDVQKYLRKAGLHAMAETEESVAPKSGDVILVGNGGSVLFYIGGHDQAVREKLIKALQASDFAGVIFTKAGGGGTFSFAQALIDSSTAPDVVMAFRWKEGKNEFGAPGLIDSDWNRKAGKGTHATLSPTDLHNTLIASGPDFKRGAVDGLPTGNTDLAPTILQILKIKPEQEMDGRVLGEALMEGGDPAPTAESETLEASAKTAIGEWHQWLRRAHVGRTIYLDAGNNGPPPGD